MSDIIVPNYALSSANNAFSAVWELTRAMKKAGWTYKASSDGSTKDTTGTAANDKWGGNVDPLADAFPSTMNTVVAWWLAQGPTTIKLGLSAAPTGTFIRGEKVTQATTAAEGEIVGFDFDSSGLIGHAVILPRTGTFNGTNVVTGAVSSATLTPTSLRTFVREIVFFKAADTGNGSIYMQCISNEDENSSRFSVLSGAAGCTATVAPGAGGTSNALPTLGTYVACGSQISGTPAHSPWFQVTTNLGKAQVVATNCTAATNVSADGSFWCMIGDLASATQCEIFGYFRCDDSEEGDLDPFVFLKLTGTSVGSANARTDATGSTSLAATSIIGSSSGSISWHGWRRRGFASADAYQSCLVINSTIGGGSVNTLADNNPNPETVACSYTTKRIRERIPLMSTDNTKKMRKGDPRWMWIIQGGTTFDTADGKLKVLITPSSPTNGAFLVGPYDGASVPLQS
jgi:hypothetical protein